MDLLQIKGPFFHFLFQHLVIKLQLLLNVLGTVHFRLQLLAQLVGPGHLLFGLLLELIILEIDTG